MAITADIELDGGIPLAGAYIRYRDGYVKVFEDDEGEKEWKLIYDVAVYKDQAARDAGEKPLSVRAVDHFKCDYDLDTTTNLPTLAYTDLKTRDAITDPVDM
jgi:hypothetical protein